MKYTFTLSLLGLALIVACQRSSISYQPTAEPFELDYQIDRFESEIKNFEKERSEKGIQKESVLFYGSSSWRLWKNIKTDLAPLPIINHGFGGSTIPELIHYADRAVLPYQPKLLVIYGGENDLTGKKYKSPEQMFDTYRQFTALVQNRFPKTKICFVSMKLSPSRRKHWEAVKKGNALVKAFSTGKYLSYVDINSALFRTDGTVKSELYTQDSLHLNAQGYREFTKVLLPFLTKKYK